MTGNKINLFLLFSGFLILFSCSDQKNKKLTFDPVTKLDFKPNIVWLIAEDLGPVTRPFGDSTVNTPNLDRLAGEGVRYTNVFSPSGVRAPGRSALVTGMYPSGIGAQNSPVRHFNPDMDQSGLSSYEIVPPPEVKMMSQILRVHGYFCTNNDFTDYQFRPPVTAWDESGLRAHWRHRPAGKLFFSVFNFSVTREGHLTEPFGRKWLRYYDRDFPDINPGDYNGSLNEYEWAMNVWSDLKVPVPPYLSAAEPVLKNIRRLYSNIIELDRQIGIILNQLEQDGLLDSTIVVFYGDQGGPLPRQKRTIYDSGIKVPMIIRYPGRIGAGTYDDQMISFVDFAPTTFSITGIKIPGYMQGQAFLGREKTKHHRKYIFAAEDRIDHHADMIRAVRDRQFKYLRNFYPERPYYFPVKAREQLAAMQELLRLHAKDSLDEFQSLWFRQSKPEEELFDTEKDPDELNNIASDPSYIDKLTELRQECEQWMNAIHDMGKIPEPEIIEKFWPGGIQPVTKKPAYRVKGEKLFLESETTGADIGYQIIQIGEIPGNNWKVYTGPIEFKENTMVIAVAHRLGYKPSEWLKIAFD